MMSTLTSPVRWPAATEAMNGSTPSEAANEAIQLLTGQSPAAFDHTKVNAESLKLYSLEETIVCLHPPALPLSDAIVRLWLLSKAFHAEYLMQRRRFLGQRAIVIDVGVEFPCITQGLPQLQRKPPQQLLNLSLVLSFLVSYMLSLLPRLLAGNYVAYFGRVLTFPRGVAAAIRAGTAYLCHVVFIEPLERNRDALGLFGQWVSPVRPLTTSKTAAPPKDSLSLWNSASIDASRAAGYGSIGSRRSMEDEHTVIADLRVLNDELQGIASYLRRRPDSPSPESSTPQDTFHGRHISVPIFHTDQPLHTTRRQGRAQEMEQCASGNCSLCMKYLKELFVSPATEEAPAEVHKGEASSGTTGTAGTTGTTGTASATASPAAFPKVSTQGPYAFPFSAVSRVLSPASIAAAAAANGDAPMTSYFAVFDGHCGREAAHLSKLLLPIFLLASKNYWIDLQKALFEAFAAVDEVVLQASQDNGWEAGTTAVVAVIRGAEMAVAHTGDSRAVLSVERQAVPITTDHSPDDEKEYERILQCGGSVICGRVQGILATSRALGDYSLDTSTKLTGISAEPTMSRSILNGSEEFLLIACDGVWDVFTNEEAVQFIWRDIVRGSSTQEAVKRLVLQSVTREDLQRYRSTRTHTAGSSGGGGSNSGNASADGSAAPQGQRPRFKFANLGALLGKATNGNGAKEGKKQ